MRELERDPLPSPLNATPLVVVGRGRVGRSFATAAAQAGIEVRLVAHHEAVESIPPEAAVLLCVPDRAIAELSSQLSAPAPALIGHVSGAMTLEALAPATRLGGAFSLHPLQTFVEPETPLEGTRAAVAGSDQQSLDHARALAEALGMRPFDVPEESRAAYHAAAALSSNLLVALEESAAHLLERIGVEDARQLLAPLVLRTAANWAERGPDALTGPVARGDLATVERHRAAIAVTAPELLPSYDALTERAEALGGESRERASA